MWGSNGWIFLHTVCFFLDEARQEDARMFFTSLGNMLPCQICRHHYNKYLSSNPLPMPITRESMSKWLVDCHNEVNIRNGKPTMSFEDAKKFYTTLTPEYQEGVQKSFIIGISVTISVCVFMMVLLLILFLKKRKAQS